MTAKSPNFSNALFRHATDSTAIQFTGLDAFIIRGVGSSISRQFWLAHTMKEVNLTCKIGYAKYTSLSYLCSWSSFYLHGAKESFLPAARGAYGAWQTHCVIVAKMLQVLLHCKSKTDHSSYTVSPAFPHRITIMTGIACLSIVPRVKWRKPTYELKSKHRYLLGTFEIHPTWPYFGISLCQGCREPQTKTKIFIYKTKTSCILKI